MKFLANLSRQKKEEINELKMNEPKFKQQGLLCRNGLDTKQILIHANFLTGSVICQKSFQTEKFPDFFRAKK